MKGTDKKAEFIELRSQGMSYAKIAEALHISKSTCSAWEKELQEQISESRRERLLELYSLYGMHKESRVESLGKLLQRIDNAIAETDLSCLPAEKLLDLRIKYGRELQKEYEYLSTPLKENSLEEILAQFKAILEKCQTGTITAQQAKTQITAVSKALETMRAIDKRDNPLDFFGSF